MRPKHDDEEMWDEWEDDDEPDDDEALEFEEDE